MEEAGELQCGVVEEVKLLGIQINSLHFTAAGSTIELGYYYKPSDDESCDDVTMGHTDVHLSNEDVVPFLDAIVEASKEKLTLAALKSISQFEPEAVLSSLPDGSTGTESRIG